ncbi:hypothetical protein JJB09_26270 [Rhizobium sp. KVB221]|uniref:Uncharacterized protein n=1 Tax=Rhizobium setariae TaxID=2801340 RepID=A0A937CRY1_9HYPH|nr:hypothetical protein [Rhizobium setariae]MBL0375517.1 hypothetical protein [Rhizobium setariae]
MSFVRDYGRGPPSDETVAWLDKMRPHLARSLSLAARLKEKVAAAITETRSEHSGFLPVSSTRGGV